MSFLEIPGKATQENFAYRGWNRTRDVPTRKRIRKRVETLTKAAKKEQIFKHTLK